MTEPTRRDVMRLLAASAAALGTVSPTASFAARPEVTPLEFFAGFRDNATLGFGLGALAEGEDRGWAHAFESRMHGGAVRPGGSELAAVARRPGTFFAVLDARDGRLRRIVEAGPDRYFLGHGIYGPSGDLFFASLSETETARGLVGVFDARHRYRKIAEWATGASDPHELIMAQDGRSLWIANGGIELHPESGRAVLNEGPLQSSLVRMDLDGRIVTEVRLGASLSSLSMRHLAVLSDGSVAVGCQDQSGAETGDPLLLRARPDGSYAMLSAAGSVWMALKGYVGSVAADASGSVIGATSPRGNQAIFMDTLTGGLVTFSAADVCGMSASAEPHAFLLSTGSGELINVTVAPHGVSVCDHRRSECAWDNHIIRSRPLSQY